MKATTGIAARPFPGRLSQNVTRNLSRIALALLLPIAATLLSPTTSAAPTAPGGKRSLSTMTVNLYIGAATEAVTTLDPTDPNFYTNLVLGVTQIYGTVMTSEPAARIDRVAAEIAARQPDVVAVEEATTLSIRPDDNTTPPAYTIVLDYEQLLLNALATRGLHYTTATRSSGWDIEMPMLNMATFALEYVRQTDHQLVLVRDLPPGQLRASNPQGGQFEHLLQIPTLGISVQRGWCSIDLFIRGENLRYICAHLEEETAPVVQVQQVTELLGGPANTTLPVVIAGDFNADPLHRDGTVAYDAMPAAGYRDAWGSLHADAIAGGLTWGHDEYLANPGVLFDRRIDFIFFKGTAFTATSADVIDLAMNRTTRPLWASDHAALAVELAIKGR